MKKERFREIVSNYASTTDEINSLKKLANEYPFSQIIHLLLAHATKSNNDQDFKPSLTNAAFYATDRSILKSLIEHNLVPSEKAITPITNPIISESPKKTTNQTVAESSPIDSDKLVADVLANLEKLQKIKKEAAIWLDSKTPKKHQKPAHTNKKLIAKPKASKKISKPKSQTKIIEKFIKEERSITKNTKPMNEKQDMAQESVKMRDDVISESLAKIYVKQGKNTQAINIYKKLIWKFPQKKTLFAAQIEKLKKK